MFTPKLHFDPLSKITDLSEKGGHVFNYSHSSFMLFIHELIHILHHFEGSLHVDLSFPASNSCFCNSEEEVTIRGAVGRDDHFNLSENYFRGVYGIPRRVAHVALEEISNVVSRMARENRKTSDFMVHLLRASNFLASHGFIEFSSKHRSFYYKLCSMYPTRESRSMSVRLTQGLLLPLSKYYRI